MNILFVLYGDFSSNSANPLVLYARELHLSGHSCAVAVPSKLETVCQHESPTFRPILYGDVLAAPEAVFPDGRPADVIHACTPREVIRRFITSYMAKQPTPLVIYLEDNELWISTREAGLDDASLFQHTQKEISDRLPDALSHPFLYDSFIGLADAVAVIQDKLNVEVPPWVHCETVMIGVDLQFYSPRPPDLSLRAKYGVAENEKVIVYHGGLDQFKMLAIETLCKAVGLINRQGYSCRLLRSGLRPLGFLDQLPHETAAAISDLGMLPKHELPDLLALADVFVQPGKIDPFEDLRLPGKVPEFLAMGRPVVMPDVNIAHLFRDGLDAVLLRSGTAEEIAAKCIGLFSDPQQASMIGRAGRLLAEKYFDVRSQACGLEDVYKTACNNFNPAIASEVWRVNDGNTPITLLLARKLRLLADLRSTKFGFEAGEMLGEHARYIELMERRVKGLDAGMAERDGQIANLSQAVAERDGQIANLSQAVAERDGQITNLSQAVAELRESTSWRLTTPVRFIGRQLLHIRKRLALVFDRSRLASGIRFGRYSLNRGRDWHTRNGRLPRIGELNTLIKRTVSEWQYRQFQGIDALSLPAGFVLPKQLDPYQSWIITNQSTERANERQRKRLSHTLGILPKISIVMPVYNPPQEFFELAVASLRNQSYENWELCIADDASSAPWLRPRLQELADDDKRIRICFREQNGNISLASNSAAELATGDFLLFFDQDDLLTIDALAEVALYLAEHTTTDVLYSDDDKIDSDGKRFAPQFKPDWSPELLLSYMYFSHLFVVRRILFEAVNGFRQGFEGSQDYDLALRVTERARSIAHLPYVLYHWRVLPGSTAASGDAKPASFEAGRRAVAEALARRDVVANVFRPEWAIKGATGIFWHDFPDEGPSVSILIPTKNQKEILKRCIDSLDKTSYRNFEMVVIDNGSDDQDTLEYLDSLQCRVLKIQNPTEKFNYAYINNRAAEQVDSKYVLFLNNDTEARDSKWLSRMVGYAGLAGVGAVGARLLYPDGRIQHAGIVHGYYDGMAGPAFKLQPSWHHGYLSYGMVARNYSAVTAACLLTPRQFFLEHGGFDEKHFSVAYNDVDYCYRLVDSGFRCVYSPSSELYHHEGLSRGFKDDPSEVLAFRHKYSGRVDRYYNPNLSLHNEQFEIQPRRLVKFEDERPIHALMCAFNLNLEGAPYSQYEMTVELARKGVIAPVVYSPIDGALRSLYESAGIEVIVQAHPLNGVFTADAYDLGVDKFSNWIRERNFEVVYGNTLQTFYAIDAARRCGLPSLWNVRESEPWQTYFNCLPSPLVPKALACFSFPYRIIFVAHATRSRFEPLNTGRNFCMIHNGLNMHRLEESRTKWGRAKAREELHLDGSEIAVLLLGTVCSRKGQKDIVEAMSLLSDDAIQKVRLFIVGDRPSSYSAEMRAMASTLPEERSKRIAIIAETDETALYYSAADIFVCTSRVESYPRVILEAMAYGLPIISTPVFGIVEQVRDGVNGEFYQEGNAMELADKIKSLVFDKVKRETYQMNSAIVLESLTGFEEMINQYAELFRESVAA